MAIAKQNRTRRIFAKPNRKARHGTNTHTNTHKHMAHMTGCSEISYLTGANENEVKSFASRAEACLQEALASIHLKKGFAFEEPDSRGYSMPNEYFIFIKGFPNVYILAEGEEDEDELTLTLVYREGHMESHLALEEYRYQIMIRSLNLKFY